MRMHIIDMHNYCNIGMVDWFFPIPLITIPLAIGTCKNRLVDGESRSLQSPFEGDNNSSLVLVMT